MIRCDFMLTRNEALDLVKANISKKNVVFHMIAVEAVMKGLAKHLGEDEVLWGLTGLLHDIDYEKVDGAWKNHGIVAEEILKGRVSEIAIHAIKSHNYENTGITPKNRLDIALIASDSISGLLVACALVMPSKRLRDVKVKTVEKKFKSKDFAKGVSRERVQFCEKIGVPMDQFFEISLESLKQYAAEIGL